MSRLIIIAILLLATGPVAQAGRVPLLPEELQQEADLIVVGTVLRHFGTVTTNKDESQTTQVHLTLRVDEVDKGESAAVAVGSEIEVACWVVTRLPRKGTVWDSGHVSIPGDESRARFYLKRRPPKHWDVIYPNGVERLDDVPTLQFRLSPPEPEPSWTVAIVFGGGFFLAGAGTFVWLFLTRPTNPATSGQAPDSSASSHRSD